MTNDEQMRRDQSLARTVLRELIHLQPGDQPFATSLATEVVNRCEPATSKQRFWLRKLSRSAANRRSMFTRDA